MASVHVPACNHGFLSVKAVQDSPKLPPGSPAEQVAEIQAHLDAAQAEYIRKVENATTTAERDRLVKEAPLPETYAEKMN